MATRLQRKANRKNARQSTGPSTPEGKARSSQNATTHGLFARDVVLPDENPQEFLDSIAELEQELGAVGGFERRLVHYIACTEWRLRRLVRLETGSLSHQLEKERLRELRIQADLSRLSPALQPNPGGQHLPKQPNPAGQDPPELDDRVPGSGRGSHARNRSPEPPAENPSSQANPIGRNTQSPGQTQSHGNTPSPGNTQSPDGYGSSVATRDYQQTTQELGASTVAYYDRPILLTLSLYESRLNRKYLTLLKQLRQTQKNRPSEASAQNQTPQPQPETTQRRGETTEPGSETTEPGSETTEPGSETTEPGSETTEPGSETTEPRHETADLRQAKEMSEDSPACGTRPGPQDKVTSVA